MLHPDPEVMAEAHDTGSISSPKWPIFVSPAIFSHDPETANKEYDRDISQVNQLISRSTITPMMTYPAASGALAGPRQPVIQ